MKKVIVVGGGASGIMAAITAAEHGASVTILEHKDRIGKKILMTGNGKCNLSNLSFSDSDYYTDTPGFLSPVFQQFSVDDTILLFREIGLLTKEKKGYLYPMSEQASTVLDVLRIQLERLQVKVITDCEIQKIIPNNTQIKTSKTMMVNELAKVDHGLQTKQAMKTSHGNFQVLTSQGSLSCDALILACGSKAAPQTGSDGSGYVLARKMGHSIIQPLPALVQLRCQENYLKAVAGVRCEAKIRLYVDGKLQKEEQGELQLTDYGISGIPVFQLSRIAAKALDQKRKVDAKIDLLPSMDSDEIVDFLTGRGKDRQTKLTVEEAMLGLMNKKLLLMVLKLNHCKTNTSWRELTGDRRSVDGIIHTIKNWQLSIQATNPFQNAQVCCGGISCKELQSTMESRIVPNLYFAGEIVDVDGICGGYNLQWAWSSGYVAGVNAAEPKIK
ncbi:MAG: NAD(P)/FAD-dependent oxidoreductase [Lachnospiraceae bacterium]|nr:NAD(P)/FAD-dependent oxidoreductase [Lachnospiraceae bacterium]